MMISELGFGFWRRRNERLLEWHRWFAWKPVTTMKGEKVWGRWVYRRGVPLGLGVKRMVVFVYGDSPREEGSVDESRGVCRK